MQIDSVEYLHHIIRRGPYAWPGGCTQFFITASGDAIDFRSVEENWPAIKTAIESPGTDPDWEVVGVDVNWEDPWLYCAHSDRRIKSAYAEKD